MNSKVEKFLKELSRAGMKVLRNEELVGESGIKHRFPLVILKKEKKVVFDYMDPGKPLGISAFATYVKALDVKAEKCFLIVDDEEKMEELRYVADDLSLNSFELILEDELAGAVKGLMEDG